MGALFRRQIQSEEAIVVYNPDAIEKYPSYEVYVPVVVVKPKIDQGVVTSRVGNTNYIEFEPLQNLHALIFPEHPDEKIPGVKHIIFNEDYQYDLIDPDLLEELTNST